MHSTPGHATNVPEYQYLFRRGSTEVCGLRPFNKECSVPEYQYLFRCGSTEVRGRRSNKCKVSEYQFLFRRGS
jgi:hypothetical protein